MREAAERFINTLVKLMVAFLMKFKMVRADESDVQKAVTDVIATFLAASEADALESDLKVGERWYPLSEYKVFPEFKNLAIPRSVGLGADPIQYNNLKAEISVSGKIGDCVSPIEFKEQELFILSLFKKNYSSDPTDTLETLTAMLSLESVADALGKYQVREVSNDGNSDKGDILVTTETKLPVILDSDIIAKIYRRHPFVEASANDVARVFVSEWVKLLRS